MESLANLFNSLDKKVPISWILLILMIFMVIKLIFNKIYSIIKPIIIKESIMSRQSALPVSDEIWRMIKETQKNLKVFSAGQKELQESQKETDRYLKNLSAELRTSQKELQESQKETDRYLKNLSAELRTSQKETGQQMKETDKKINTIIGDFGNRWGKLGENLVKGSLVQRLKERGIEVERVITNAKNAKTEFDIIAVNGKEVVVVEVKATLDPADVREFTEDIKNFKVWWPEFKNKTIYGAMAFLIKANRQANSLAEKQGFFVIEATGDVIIQNKENFKPKIFS